MASHQVSNWTTTPTTLSIPNYTCPSWWTFLDKKTSTAATFGESINLSLPTTLHKRNDFITISISTTTPLTPTPTHPQNQIRSLTISLPTPDPSSPQHTLTIPSTTVTHTMSRHISSTAYGISTLTETMTQKTITAQDILPGAMIGAGGVSAVFADLGDGEKGNEGGGSGNGGGGRGWQSGSVAVGPAMYTGSSEGRGRVGLMFAVLPAVMVVLGVVLVWC